MRLLVAMHLLVIGSLLFSTTAAAMPLSKPGSRAADATQRTLARPRPSVTDTNQPQPFLSLASLQAGNADPYTNLQNISYTYDDVGNVLKISDAAAYGGSQTQSFSYDTLDRLSTAQASGSTTYGGYTQRSYAYSNAGNITSFEGAALTYQNSAHKHAVTHIGGVQKYWYDANGNATRRINGSQDVTLTYDAENRLTGISGGVTASYVYDGDSNRVKETIGGATVGDTTEYDRLAAGLRQWMARGAAGATTLDALENALREAGAIP